MRKSNRGPASSLHPGSVPYFRAKLEEKLHKVARVQFLLFKPEFIIKMISPGVAVATLVGMKYVSMKQIIALETVVNDHAPMGVVVILSIGSARR